MALSKEILAQIAAAEAADDFDDYLDEDALVGVKQSELVEAAKESALKVVKSYKKGSRSGDRFKLSGSQTGTRNRGSRSPVTTMSNVAEVAGGFLGDFVMLQGSFKSDIMIDDLLRYSYQKQVPVFYAAAATAANSFPHMYEPDGIGIHRELPLFRLTAKRTGKGAFNIGFRMRQSRMTAPSLEERGVTLASGSGQERKHIFRMRAPVIEFGLPVKIAPKNAKVMVMPLSDPMSGAKFARRYSQSNEGRSKHYIVQKSPVKFSPGKASGLAGNFNSFFQGPASTMISNGMVDSFREQAEDAANAIIQRRGGHRSPVRRVKSERDEVFEITFNNSLKGAAQRAVKQLEARPSMMSRFNRGDS